MALIPDVMGIVFERWWHEAIVVTRMNGDRVRGILGDWDGSWLELGQADGSTKLIARQAVFLIEQEQSRDRTAAPVAA